MNRNKPASRRRYSFWKIALWVVLINAFFLGLALLIIYQVKYPFQTYNLADFNPTRYWFRGAVSATFQCIFYFFALNRYYRLIAEKKDWRYYTGWSLFFILCCFVYYLLYDLTITKEEFKIVPHISLKIFTYSFSTVFNIGFVLLVVLVTRQLDEKKAQQIRQKELERQKAQLEKEKMQADYSFLKAQINPHFLHNTLNFLYSRSLPYSSELSEGILTLSEIMRYALNKAEDPDGKVLLTQEIEHMHNIIRIQQLRFENALQVVFTTQGELEGLRILPFVLITLVENAFKHGELKNSDHPVTISLSVTGGQAGREGGDIPPSRQISAPGTRQQTDGAGTGSGKKLVFSCVNRKKTGPKELSTGIGLDNTRKRLELAYGQDYSLYIKDGKELFTVELTLNL